MKKAELRTLFTERRSQLSVTEASRLSARIADRFFDAINLNAARTLHTFIRIHKFNEVDTSAIYFRMWRDNPAIKTVAPKVDFETGKMSSVIFDGSTELTENRWGIREPEVGATIPPDAIDIVLVPGLCFDRHGHRVGYGRGYYDRFLTSTRPDCIKVGLCFFDPISGIDDAHQGDVRVDRLITPDATFTSP